MTEKNIASDALGLLYGAAAAQTRGDSEALDLLTEHDVPNRAVWEAAIVITAQALRSLGSDFRSSEITIESTVNIQAAGLLQAAAEFAMNDREAVHFSVLELDRTGLCAIRTGAAVIAAIWSVAAEREFLGTQEYARRLCLAAGTVISQL